MNNKHLKIRTDFYKDWCFWIILIILILASLGCILSGSQKNTVNYDEKISFPTSSHSPNIETTPFTTEVTKPTKQITPGRSPLYPCPNLDTNYN